MSRRQYLEFLIERMAIKLQQIKDKKNCKGHSALLNSRMVDLGFELAELPK